MKHPEINAKTLDVLDETTIQTMAGAAGWEDKWLLKEKDEQQELLLAERLKRIANAQQEGLANRLHEALTKVRGSSAASPGPAEKEQADGGDNQPEPSEGEQAADKDLLAAAAADKQGSDQEDAE